MANRYANLVGSNKIKDEYQKINQGFDAVEADMDQKADAGDLTNLQNTVNDHIGAGGNAHATATTSSAGFMSAADKQKLDGIEEGAEPNQNAFAKVNNIEAGDPSDELIIEGGTGITVTENPLERKVTITATGQAIPGPHGSSHTEHGADPIPNATTSEGGLMSADHVQMLESHASRHAAGGADPLTPEMIGAETPAGAQAKVDAHASRTDNPHGVTKAQVGLGNVDNVKQASKSEFDAHLADYADLKGYIGYTENDIVGVEADFVNSKFTRLAGAINKTPGADFDSINAFGGRKRCILTDDGVVLAYYGEPGYVETGKLTQAITIGEEENAVTYSVGTPVQVMVEQPKFYYKVVPLQLEPIADGIGYHLRKARYYVSDTPKVGFKVHPAFVRNGVEVDKIYLSAYEGSIYDESAGTYLLADEQIADFNADKLSSIAYAKPASGLTQNLTRANTRKLAENRGAGWQQKDVLCASASQMLMMIEYAAFNMQSAIGLGVVNKPSGEGNESEFTGATTNLGNASGMAVGTNGLVSISYRGEENFWGNIWKWIDGLNVYIDPDTRKIDAYWAAEDFSDDTGSAPYKHVGFNLAPNTNGYVSAFGWSEECDFLFLPTETLGNSALPVGDRFYNTQTGWRVPRLGGLWSNGLDAGAFCWHVNSVAATQARDVGCGAVYVPQAS